MLDPFGLLALMSCANHLHRIRCADCFERTLDLIFGYVLRTDDFVALTAVVVMTEKLIEAHNHKHRVRYCSCHLCLVAKLLLFNPRLCALAFCCLQKVPAGKPATAVLALLPFTLFIRPSAAKVDQLWPLVDAKGAGTRARLSFLGHALHMCDTLQHRPDWLDRVVVDQHNECLCARLKELKHIDCAHIRTQADAHYAQLERERDARSATLQYTQDELERY